MADSITSHSNPNFSENVPTERDVLISSTKPRGSKRLLKTLLIVLGLVAVAGTISFVAFSIVDGKSSNSNNSEAGGPDALTLYLFDPEETDARCLDGSPSGFYYRAGTDGNFVIFMEGGGICDGPEDCIRRSVTTLGTSTLWSRYKYPTNINDVSDRSNPFVNSTHVFIPYCGGDGHSGSQTDKNLYGLYHAGYLTVNATVEWLIENANMSNANRVLVTGASAGGIGTMINADFIKDALPNVIVKASPLGGYYFPRSLSTLEEWRRSDLDGDYDLLLARGLAALYQTKLHPVCVANHNGPPEECATQGILHPYIETPLLIAENIFDLEKTTRLDIQEALPNETDAFNIYYGDKAVSSILNGIATSSNPSVHGYFLPSCTDHTQNLGIPDPLTLNANDNVSLTYGQVLESWFFEIDDVNDTLLDSCWSDSSGPCNPQCDN